MFRRYSPTVRSLAYVLSFDLTVVPTPQACVAEHALSRVATRSCYYIACAGMPNSCGSARADAVAAVRLASDIIALAEKHDLPVCVTLASGSLVGALLDTDPISYHVLGEIVNTVRIEDLQKHCPPFQIQIWSFH